MKCKQCGFENVQDARVCARCKASLSTGADRIKKVTVEEAVQMMEKKVGAGREEAVASDGAENTAEQEKKDGIHRFGWIFIGLGISLALIGLLLIVTMLM